MTLCSPDTKRLHQNPTRDCFRSKIPDVTVALGLMVVFFFNTKKIYLYFMIFYKIIALVCHSLIAIIK